MVKNIIRLNFFVFATMASRAVLAQDDDLVRRSMKVMGATATWELPNKVEPKFTTMAEIVANNVNEALDPDCIWRAKKPDGACPVVRDKSLLATALKKAAEFNIETQGYFNILRNPKDPASGRDFGGMNEGFFIDQLKNSVEGPLSVNFAGAFYVRKVDPFIEIIFADPLLQIAPFAKIHLTNAWAHGSSSRATGAEIRNPNRDPAPWHEEFQTIQLFARLSFEGARLQAWSTALVPGGLRLLKHLQSLKPFEGQWAYAYIDRNGKLVCSSLIHCEGEQNGKRLVTVDF